MTPTTENPCGVVFQPMMTSSEILAKGNFVKIDQLPGLFAKGALIDKNIKDYVALKLKKYVKYILPSAGILLARGLRLP